MALREAIASIPTLPGPVETLATLILNVHAKRAEQTRLWASVLRCMAEHQGFWPTTTIAPPPDCALCGSAICYIGTGVALMIKVGAT